MNNALDAQKGNNVETIENTKVDIKKEATGINEKGENLEKNLNPESVVFFNFSR
jgi:hypothetical protein